MKNEVIRAWACRLDGVGRQMAVGFGVGHFPVAPGTAASALGFLIFLPLQNLPIAFGCAGWVALFAAGLWAVKRHLAYFKTHDPPEVVIDEICAAFLAFMLLPASPLGWGMGFALFRFFDIVKPPPIRWIEALPGAWGIMLDDLAAALYTVVLLRLV